MSRNICHWIIMISIALSILFGNALTVSLQLKNRQQAVEIVEDESSLMRIISNNNQQLCLMVYSSLCPSCMKFLPKYQEIVGGLSELYPHVRFVQSDITKQYRTIEYLTERGLGEFPFIIFFDRRTPRTHLNCKGVSMRRVALWLNIQSKIAKLNIKEQSLKLKMSREKAGTMMQELQAWTETRKKKHAKDLEAKLKEEKEKRKLQKEKEKQLKKEKEKRRKQRFLKKAKKALKDHMKEINEILQGEIEERKELEKKMEKMRKKNKEIEMKYMKELEKEDREREEADKKKEEEQEREAERILKRRDERRKKAILKKKMKQLKEKEEKRLQKKKALEEEKRLKRKKREEEKLRKKQLEEEKLKKKFLEDSKKKKRKQKVIGPRRVEKRIKKMEKDLNKKLDAINKQYMYYPKPAVKTTSPSTPVAQAAPSTTTAGYPPPANTNTPIYSQPHPAPTSQQPYLQYQQPQNAYTAPPQYIAPQPVYYPPPAPVVAHPQPQLMGAPPASAAPLTTSIQHPIGTTPQKPVHSAFAKSESESSVASQGAMQAEHLSQIFASIVSEHQNKGLTESDIMHQEHQ